MNNITQVFIEYWPWLIAAAIVLAIGLNGWSWWNARHGY
jgi:hypothetical protein